MPGAVWRALGPKAAWVRSWDGRRGVVVAFDAVRTPRIETQDACLIAYELARGRLDVKAVGGKGRTTLRLAGVRELQVNGKPEPVRPGSPVVIPIRDAGDR